MTTFNLDLISGEVFTICRSGLLKESFGSTPFFVDSSRIDLCTYISRGGSLHELVICSIALEMMSLEAFMPPALEMLSLEARLALVISLVT